MTSPALAGILAVALTSPVAADSVSVSPAVDVTCKVARSASALGPSLARTAARLARGEPVTIVAIGSSSTAGAGASAPSASYPSRLEALLRDQFPRVAIRVINRGVGGQEAVDMLARFGKDVLAQNPDLILWQVGTNAILRDPTVAGEAPLIRRGIQRLKATGADVVLIDPQYAPKVVAKPEAQRMIDLIGFEARENGAGLFRRFALMRDWSEVQHLPFEVFVSADGIHLNDWSYDCIARHLAAAITDAVASRATVSTASAK